MTVNSGIEAFSHGFKGSFKLALTLILVLGLVLLAYINRANVRIVTEPDSTKNADQIKDAV